MSPSSHPPNPPSSYVERLEGQFKQRVNQIFKLRSKLQEATERHNDIAKNVAKVQPDLAQKIDDVMALKACVEADVSKLYDNRAVHIVGAINMLRSGL
jgi:hypothetical protein